MSVDLHRNLPAKGRQSKKQAERARARPRPSVGTVAACLYLLMLLGCPPASAATIYADDPAVGSIADTLFENAEPPSETVEAPPPVPGDISKALDADRDAVALPPELSGAPLLNAAQMAADLEELRVKFVANGMDTTAMDIRIAGLRRLAETDLGANVSGTPVARSEPACSYDAVKRATAPLIDFLTVHFQRHAETSIPVRFTHPYITLDKQLEIDRLRQQRARWELDALASPPTYDVLHSRALALDDAEVIDAVLGGNRWSATWHQLAATSYVTFVAGFVQSAMEAEARYLPDVVYSYVERPDPAVFLDRGSELAPAEIAELYRALGHLRQSLLAHLAAWMTHLDSAGCAGLANYVRAFGYSSLAVGAERDSVVAMPASFWNAYFPDHVDYEEVTESYVQHVGWSFQFYPALYWWDTSLNMLASEAEALDVITGGQTVESALGPLVQVEPAFEVVPNTSSDGSNVPEPVEGAIDSPVGRGSAIMELGKAPPDDLPESDPDEDDHIVDTGWTEPPEISDTGTATAEVTGGSWLTVGGVGLWPQELNGYWRTAGLDDGDLTLISLTEDGRNLTGDVIAKGEPGGTWIDVTLESGAAWRGQVHTALKQPKGKCPRWRDGVLVVQADRRVIEGAWAGARTNPDTCELGTEPDGGPFTLERLVAASFQPIAPGKYIHIIGVPGAGSTRAQYAAAVEFACEPLEGTLPATITVAASAGTIVELEPCRYQLAVDAPGDFDITISLVNQDGVPFHVETLHATIPPIPGVL